MRKGPVILSASLKPMSIFNRERAMKLSFACIRREFATKALLVASCIYPALAVADSTDLANAPLASGLTNTTTAKPNIAFIFDDSGSMDDQNMPDDEGTNRSNRCWGWYKYNTLFYNPAVTYKPPFKLGGTVYGDGFTRFPDTTFTAALKDGYFPANGYTYGGSSTSNTTTDLSQVNNTTSSASTKYYYTVHTGILANASICDGANYTSITSADNIVAPGTTAGSAAAKTNYANWYSYYRSRALLMKAATGEAFKDLDESKYRLGLFFLNSVESGSNGSAAHKNNDLKIDDFSGSAGGTQRAEWYEKLYGARSDVYTPLRGALSRMGRMYAGQISGWDPVQYSCQQNFTILSTDGFWNTNYESGSFGPKKINGTDNVGNADGGAAAAVAARATIESDGNFGSRCYRATSITINIGGSAVELLDSDVPSSTTCSTNADGFGQAVAASISANTATGFSATYSNSRDRITITAPLALGNLTATPDIVFAKTNNQSGNETFDVTAFSNGSSATDGTVAPFRDALNVSDTLADIAQYYYATDLRSSALGNCSNEIDGTSYTGLCDNNVLGGGKDTAMTQHMTTFTVGLGVSGTIRYESNYETAPDINGVNQYYDILNESVNWPNPSTDKAKIDDLWHAAVNGRGTYYSASNAETLQAGIQAALSGIQARKGSAAAAATSSLQPVAGDNSIFIALYETGNWVGDLQSFTIDPFTAKLSSGVLWSAQEELDQQVSAAVGAGSGDGREIKFFSSGATNKLKDFTLTNLSADGLDVHFEDICGRTPYIDQCGSDADDLETAQKTVANQPGNLINYLRGRPQHEDGASNTTVEDRLYRGREHVLGDIANAVPVYVKKPPFGYDKYDATYATFKTNNNLRAPSVYVAANDGMLHAFNAENGRERWAFVPTAVMPNLWNLADREYRNNHRYFVDGSPTIADICVDTNDAAPQTCESATDWRTILVGGLNKGGCSYYALDITNPATPKGLWEFTNENLGYSFGKPVVVKRKSGQWVVIFSSGYNNVPNNGCGSSGDGNGHVFVVDAKTGALLEDIPTYTNGSSAAGSVGTPSGLARLNAWVDDAALPIGSRVYGGDVLGNVWRIDFDDNHPPSGKEAVLLAQLKDANNNSQPVTIKPVLGELNSGQAVVMVGTGKYLGVSDPSDVAQQSVYALKDSLLDSGIGSARGNSMVQRTLAQATGTGGRTIRTISGNTISWATNNGWYFDLNPGGTSPGERVNVDMALQFNLLAIAANVPDDNACTVGGRAFLYNIDFSTGKNMLTAEDGAAGRELPGNALVVGIDLLQGADRKLKVLCTDSTGNLCTEDGENDGGGSGAGARRTSWREIAD